jgi:DNA uptake protein ComE-like DNA-binding protein
MTSTILRLAALGALCAAVLTLGACGSSRPGGGAGGWTASQDALVLRELTGEEAHALLDFVNSADAAALDAVPNLTAGSIAGILASRPFDVPSELLSIPGIGPTTLMVLVAYTSDRGNRHPVCPEADAAELCFSRATAIAMVHLANRATFEQLADSTGVSLSDAISQNVIDGRPYASLEEVAAVSGIGPFALLKLEAMVYQLAQEE